MARRLRSALFIDFENVAMKVEPRAVAAWLAWFEDGCFEGLGRRRRLLSRRIYWNASHEVHRSAFEAAGFQVIRCDKYALLKNGADIRIALDVTETLYEQPGIEEFILITQDTDFVPVLERLKAKGKRTAILADEHRPVIFTSLAKAADIAIPYRRLSEAFVYQRPSRSLFDWMRGGVPGGAATKLATKLATKTAGKTAGNRASGTSPGTARQGANAKRSGTDKAVVAVAAKATANEPAERAGTTIKNWADTLAVFAEQPASAVSTGNPADNPVSPDVIDLVAGHVIAIARATPRIAIARKTIEAEVATIGGFARSGPHAYFGKGTYRELMREIGRRNARLKVSFHGGGMSVSYVPAKAGD